MCARASVGGGSSRHGDQNLERDAKRIKADTILHFPIHQVAVQHSIAASDSDEDQPIHGADSTWWNEVEAQIDDDLRADREWWSEVEDAIRSDEVVENTNLGCNEAGGKRELVTFRCTGGAERV